jgi:hypothetical protein
MEIRDIFDVAQHFQMNLLVDYSFIFINNLIVFILINHLKLFCPLLLLKNLAWFINIFFINTVVV